MGRVIGAEAWTALEVSAGGAGLTRQRVAPHAPIDIFLAVEHPLKVRLVSFALPDAAAAQSLAVPAAAGITVRTVPLADGPGWGRAEVRLVEARYAELFSTVADDVVEHVMTAASAADAVSRLEERLRRWESFLRVVKPDGLGEDERAGLYGELYVLREHILSLGPVAAVSAWVGPLARHQDFQGRGWAIEVKTSRTKAPASVRITSERQLDTAGLAFLALACVGLEQRHLAGETLPSIVASLRGSLAGAPVSDLFEERLLEAGYLAAHEERYQSDGYTVRFERLFRVRDGFPRLVEADLPPGAGDVGYSLSLPVLEPFAVDWSTLKDELGAQLAHDA